MRQKVISVTSGVSAKRGVGFVTVAWGDEVGQLSTEEARAHALGIIEAADAADFDAALVKALGGMDQQTAQILGAIRAARGNLNASGKTTITPDEPESR